MADKNVQRLPAEELFQRDLDALISAPILKVSGDM